jgi:phage shock protein PspC (stress-responsive transcriptional regulator)
MKKNISINISGIIFHIEEDGYENLRRYLDSITKYFSSFEDSSEIMADIESRIAEIFLSKLNEGKQVITADDVNALIATMGSVSDFKAAEEQPQPGSTYQNAGSASYSEPSGSGAASATYAPAKVLRRDQKRKILGGVCAGIANYMNVDSLWVRLIFALFAFAWGFTIIVYIIMWIVVPGTYDLSEPEVGKKMFRDPERKILAGVSGGVASYLNIDILAVRILFILLTLAGGLGIFLYIILWVVLPEARTLTDRMQMQGEPVTLSNIESTIKKNQESEGSVRQESDLTKVIMFPFRIIGLVLQALAKVIGPLAEAVRVIVGIIIVGLGLMFLISILGAGGMTLGILSTTMDVPWQNQAHELGIPLDPFMRAVPGWLIFAGFIGLVIPALVLLLLGISVIAKRIVFSPTVGWSLFAMFFICIALLSVGIPNIVYSFKETGEYQVENEYNLPGKAVLKINQVGMDDYDNTWLNLKGYSGKTFKLVQVFRAQGSTKAKAIENSKMVDYHVSQQDSVITFDSNLIFKQDAIFRGQQVDLTLYIPYNRPFVMDRAIMDFISQYIGWEQRDENHTWQITEENGLECITCPKPTPEEIAKEDLKDFDQLDLHGIFDVRIIKGDNYDVELKGPESEKEKYNIYRNGKTLIVDFEGKKNFNWDWNFDKVKDDQVYISITMPGLERLEATGFGNIRFEEFHVNDMEFELTGPVEVDGTLHAEDVMINLSGKSQLTLSGHCNTMSADIQFASKLKAYNFEANEAVVDVTGASSAKLNVAHRLEIEEGVASDIDFRGNPEVIRNNN